MVTFHIKLDYLESVEIVLSALRESSNPDCSAIADGILRTLIRVEDGIATHFGGTPIPHLSPETILTNTPEPLTTSPNPPLASTVSTHVSSKSTQPKKLKYYPPFRVIQGGKSN